MRSISNEFSRTLICRKAADGSIKVLTDWETGNAALNDKSLIAVQFVLPLSEFVSHAEAMGEADEKTRTSLLSPSGRGKTDKKPKTPAFAKVSL